MPKKKEDSIRITSPKAFQVVGVKFRMFGDLPKSFLLHGQYGLGIDWVDIEGNDLPMSGPLAHTFRSIFPWSNRVSFLSSVNLSYFDPKEYARGLILIIETYEGERAFHLHPVIIEGTKESSETELQELRDELSNGVEKTKRLREDWENYKKELNKLGESLLGDSVIREGVFEILDKTLQTFTPFSESDEDKQRLELDKKYKETLSRHGPLLRGIAGRMEGFEIRVYSDDHGKHFHVVHKEKGIDARFSFPEMELLSHISAIKIGAKTKKKIQEFCKRPEIFANLEKEFTKRI